jgi:hypothetical protein
MVVQDGQERYVRMMYRSWPPAPLMHGRRKAAQRAEVAGRDERAATSPQDRRERAQQKSPSFALSAPVS